MISRILRYLPNPWLERDRQIERLKKQVHHLVNRYDQRGIELREAQEQVERLKAELDACLRYSFEVSERRPK